MNRRGAKAYRGVTELAGTDLLEITDLHMRTRAATLPDTVFGVAAGNGRWTAVGNLGSSNVTGVVYGSADAAPWAQVATTSDGNEALTHGLSSVA